MEGRKVMNLDLYNRVKEVPETAKKIIGAGKLAGFTDINPMWRIKKLTEEFGVCGFGWYTEITNKWIEKGGDGKEAVFVEINLYVKQDGEWSKPIVGIGGSMFVNIFKGSPDTSDEAFKMAYTDALSVACKALGMAADVYYEKDRTKYNAYDNQAEKPKESKPKIEYATEEQIAKLNKYYSGKPDKLSLYLKNNNVKNLIYLPRTKAQETINKIEMQLKMQEA
jgi:hypothetical protein